jgi:hypothetical protein
LKPSIVGDEVKHGGSDTGRDGSDR